MNVAQEKWIQIDEFLSQSLIGHDPALDAALKSSAVAGLPAIQVSPCQGKLLQMMAQLCAARRILEIGTLGGYSTIWLARALPPGGRLITLELDPQYAKVASANIARANLSDVVEVRIGSALDSLPKLAAEGLAPFDFIFIDADKVSTPEYFAWALKLSRRGSLIVVDNVIRKGALLDEESADPAVQGMRRFIEGLRAEPRVAATVIQTVGSKGYDGFAVVMVTGDRDESLGV